MWHGSGSLRAARGKPEFFRVFLNFQLCIERIRFLIQLQRSKKNSTLSNPTVCGHFLLTLILLNIIIICHIIWYSSSYFLDIPCFLGETKNARYIEVNGISRFSHHLNMSSGSIKYRFIEHPIGLYIT